MNWMIKLALVAAVVAAMVGMMVAQGAGGPPKPKRSPAGMAIETIKVNGESFETEIAATEVTRTKGLGDRASIGKNEAMLFVFRVSDVQRFWMKGCLMDVDIAYLDRTGVITAVHEMKMEPPPGPNETTADYEGRLKFYGSDQDALYAMEFAPGTITRLGLKAGQTIPLDHGKLRGYLR